MYSPLSGFLSIYFYSLVPALQSEWCLSREVCWSEGVGREYPVPGPLLWDKWGLFLPSRAFWLMLNPFGLIILIAAPAIKTTDAFVQLWGPRNVIEGVWSHRSTLFFLKKKLIYDLFLPPTHTPSLFSCFTDCSRGQGCPTMQARLHWRSIHCRGASYRRERMASFQLWVFKIFLVLFYSGWLLCLRLSVGTCWHAHELSVLPPPPMCYISGGGSEQGWHI